MSSAALRPMRFSSQAVGGTCLRRLPAGCRNPSPSSACVTRGRGVGILGLPLSRTGFSVCLTSQRRLDDGTGGGAVAVVGKGCRRWAVRSCSGDWLSPMLRKGRGICQRANQRGDTNDVEKIVCLERGDLLPENLGLSLAGAKSILSGVQKYMVERQTEGIPAQL